MSAWVVSKTHIDAMIDAGLHGQGPYGPLSWYTENETGGFAPHDLTRLSADEVGTMLWNENHLSVNYRYDESTPTPTYRHGRLRSGPLPPVVIFKLIACFEYQSCEHPGWETSQAKRFCDALRRSEINKLPGYGEAPWGLDDADLASLSDVVEIG